MAVDGLRPLVVVETVDHKLGGPDVGKGEFWWPAWWRCRIFLLKCQRCWEVLGFDSKNGVADLFPKQKVGGMRPCERDYYDNDLVKDHWMPQDTII